MPNWQPVNSDRSHQRGSTYLPFFGSQHFGWLKEPENTWTQNWIRTPLTNGVDGHMHTEAIKLISWAVTMFFAVLGLVLLIVLFFIALDGNVQKTNSVMICAIIDVILMVCSGVWGYFNGSDWAIQRRREKRQAQALYIPVRFDKS